MDEQTYYNQSLTGLDVIAEYTRASAEANEKTANATERMYGSVTELISLYKKDSSKKSTGGKTNSPSGIGGSMSDMMSFIDKFDEESKKKGDDVIDFFSKFQAEVVEKYASKTTESFINSVGSMVSAIDKMNTIILSASQISPESAQAIARSVEVLMSGITSVTPDSAKSFSLIIDTLSKNVLNLGESMVKAAPLYSKAKSTVPRITQTIDMLFHLDKATTMSPDSARAVATIVDSLSKSVYDLGYSLSKSGKYYKSAQPSISLIGGTVSKLIETIYNNLGDKASIEKAKLAAETIMILSKGIFGLATSLAISTPLLLLAMPGALAFRGVMFLLGGSLTYLAEISPKLKDGSKAIRHLSITMLMFSGSMLLSAMIMRKFEANDVPMFIALFGALGISALLFNEIGKHAIDIIKGGVGVAAISGSIYLFALATRSAVSIVPDPAKLGLLALELGGMALLYGLIGNFAKNILLGSLAVAAIGVSLMLLASPLVTISGVISEHGDMLWKLPVLLTALGTVYALAGTPPVPALILMGAVSFAAIGASLLLIAAGLKKMSEVKMTQEDSKNIKFAMESIVRGFIDSFKGVTLKEAATLPLRIAGVAAMGGALAMLGIGVGKWKEKAGNWTNEDSDELSYTIQSLSQSFALAGSSDGMSKMFGFKVGKTDTERGIDSTMRMGKNLTRLAKGITMWKDMDLSEKTMQLITDNITRVLTTIPTIFSTIGKAERENSSNQMEILGVKFGVPFTKTDVELGIKSTMKIGSNLKSLAEGVFAWKSGGKYGFKPEDLPQIQANIISVLSSIPSAFAAIGKEDRKTAKGILWWRKGDVEKGAKIFDTIGPTLKSVSELVMGFKDIPDVSKHAENMGTGVTTILQSLSTGLSKFDKKKVSMLEDLPEPLGELTKIFLEWKDIFKDFMKMDFAKVEQAAVLALKLDRIQKGLNYTEVTVDAGDGLKTKGIEVQKQTSATDKAKRVAEQESKSFETEMMVNLLKAIQGLQETMTMNTLAINEMKTQLVSGVIKTKEMSNNEF